MKKDQRYERAGSHHLSALPGHGGRDRREREVLLVLPPPQEGYSALKMIYPPLSLLSIGSYLKRALPGTNLRILDGQVMAMVDMEREIEKSSPDVVGVGVSLLNYGNALRIGEIAKGKGAKIVFGGHYATSIPERILRNRPFVDSVVSGDGEAAFTDIVQGKKNQVISNLTYRGGDGKIHSNKRVNLDLRFLPPPDYQLLDDLDAYVNTSLKFKRVFITYAQKGCLWRERSGGCLFCARQDAGYRRKSPEAFWEDIRIISKSGKPDLLYEVSDSFATDREHLSRIAEAQPSHETPPMRILSKTTDITEQTALLLKKLRVYEVFVGIESGDPKILKRINKGTTLKSNRTAARILKNHGILFFPSIILGNPGETEESMRRTLDHVEELCRLGDVQRVYGNIMVPYPGSIIFDLFMSSPEIRKKYDGLDLFDLKEMQVDWVNRFCNVTYEDMLDQLKKADMAQVFTTPNFDRRDLERALKAAPAGTPEKAAGISGRR